MEKTNRGLKFIKEINKRLIGSFILFMGLFPYSFCFAQINIISDEETELYLQKIASPIFKSAGIPFNRSNFYIVNDDSLNAFVADGNNLFINTGTIIKSESDDEIIGVIAHEVGHIQGGHILRGKLKGQQLSEAGLASMILAGAAAVISGRGDVGAAIILGSQSSMMNAYLSYRVEEERSADEAAMKFLDENQISPEGMRDFMKKISQQNVASGIEENSYFRTHPVTSERIAFLENAGKNSKYKGKTTISEEYLRVKAKLTAFLYPPRITLRHYPDYNTIADKYAHTIVYFKQLNMDKAIKGIDDLIALEPKNPFFRELKAQMYMETGDAGKAKKEYREALKLLPRSALFKVNLAHATLEDNPSKEELAEMENNLNQAILAHPTYEAWILLARTYGFQGKKAEASYAAAEASTRIALFDVAKKQAEEAIKNAPNAALKLRINDLQNRIEQLEKIYK